MSDIPTNDNFNPIGYLGYARTSMIFNYEFMTPSYFGFWDYDMPEPSNNNLTTKKKDYIMSKNMKTLDELLTDLENILVMKENRQKERLGKEPNTPLEILDALIQSADRMAEALGMESHEEGKKKIEILRNELLNPNIDWESLKVINECKLLVTAHFEKGNK